MNFFSGFMHVLNAKFVKYTAPNLACGPFNYVLFSIVYLIENIEFGMKQVLSVVTILRLVVYFCVSYSYMLYSHTYVLRHVLSVALASAP